MNGMEQETRGQIACPICGFDKPHHHSPEEVETERYCRPAFERWADGRIRHIGQGSNASVMVHYGMVPQWNKRDDLGHYREHEVNVAWIAFRDAWMQSEASVRKPATSL